MGYDWDFGFLLQYSDAFLRGALLTLFLSVTSFVIGTVIGTLVGWWLSRLRGWEGRLLLVFNDAVRAVPILVLLFLVYYFPVRQLLGIPAFSPVAAAVVALAIGQAAYTVDVVRTALLGVPDRARWAGAAIGMSEWQVWRHLLFPEVLRLLLPTQLAFFIGIIRLSSLASVIGAPEVVFVARAASAQNYRAIESWLLVAAVYIALVLPLTILARRIERSDWLQRRW